MFILKQQATIQTLRALRRNSKLSHKRTPNKEGSTSKEHAILILAIQSLEKSKKFSNPFTLELTWPEIEN